MFISTQNYKIIFYSIFAFTCDKKLCHIKRDHLVNYYISVENAKTRYLCSSVTDLHNILA